jgi:hypothetical protein
VVGLSSRAVANTTNVKESLCEHQDSQERAMSAVGKFLLDFSPLTEIVMDKECYFPLKNDSTTSNSGLCGGGDAVPRPRDN